MNSLCDALVPLISWVGKASWQGAILVALILSVQWIWRERLAARWRYALWLLVVARLALPFTPQSQWSLFNYVRIHSAVEVAAMPPPGNGPAEIDASAQAAASASNPSPAQRSRQPAAITVSPARGATGSGTPASGNHSDDIAPPSLGNFGNRAPSLAIPTPSASDSAVLTRAPVAPPEILPLQSTSWQISWKRLIPLVWLAGALGLAGRLAWECLGLAWAIRQARPVDDPTLLAVLEKCRHQMGVSVPCPVHATSCIGSPALYGLWRTQLLVPASFIGHFTAEEWRHIFLHELAHQRRRDPLVNWLLAVLQIIHWFNPLIWIGFHRMRADRELACDALVLASADQTEAKAYGRTIVKVMESLAIATPLPGLVGLLEDKRQAERRVRMIARHRPGTRGSWAFGAILAILSFVSLSDAVTSCHDKPESDLLQPSLPIVENELVPVTPLVTAVPVETPANIGTNNTNVLYLAVDVMDADTGDAIEGAI